jgi:uncharacterized membrane protein YGL010W
MRNATDLLAQYAEYHRDRRNIVSHFVGVPMIVFGVGVLLARPTLATGGLALTPAWLLFAFVAAWYLTRGSAVLGLAVSAVVALLLWLAQQISGGSVPVWLAWGAGLVAVVIARSPLLLGPAHPFFTAPQSFRSRDDGTCAICRYFVIVRRFTG